MEVFDAVVSGLTQHGIMVILNNHNSKATWCCSEQDGEGLWWTHDYPEEVWVEALEGMADRYRDNPLVVGMDLRNELRKAHGHSPSWGDGRDKYDWAMAAEKAGNRVLSVNTRLLVLVEGLEYAGTVEGARDRPVILSHPGQLVYSGHLYPWWFDHSMPFDDLQDMMRTRQTFVMEPGQIYSVRSRVWSLWDPRIMTRLHTGWESLELEMTARAGGRWSGSSGRMTWTGHTGPLMDTHILAKMRHLASWRMTMSQYAIPGSLSSCSPLCQYFLTISRKPNKAL